MLDLDIISTNIVNNVYHWIPTVSKKTPPEFYNCFQHRLSIFDSKFAALFIDKQLNENQNFLSGLPEFELLNQCQQLLNIDRPFGKVSVWKILNDGQVGYHRDTYHYLIDRFLLNINLSNDHCDILVNDIKIPCHPGQIVTFDHTNPHCINNNQNQTIYFLAFDIFKKNFQSIRMSSRFKNYLNEFYKINLTDELIK